MKKDPALETYRDEAVQLLSDQYAADRLDVEEFERRLDLVNAAVDRKEIESAVGDLPALRQEDPDPSHSWPEAANSAPVLSILSERKLSGNWLDPGGARSVTLLASTRLDLRDTELSAGTVTVDVVAIMGEVKIIVPPDMRVENQITPLLAEVNMKGSRSGDAKKRTLRLTGFALMAEVNVVVKQ